MGDTISHLNLANDFAPANDSDAVGVSAIPHSHEVVGASLTQQLLKVVVPPVRVTELPHTSCQLNLIR